MCVNRSWVLSGRRKIAVNCGHCPACLQAKAVKQAYKIKSNYPHDGSPLLLFITLTYDNNHIPYIDGQDLASLPIQRVSKANFDLDQVGDLYLNVPIYRNRRTTFLNRGRKQVIPRRHVIGYKKVPANLITEEFFLPKEIPCVNTQKAFRSIRSLKRIQSNGHDVSYPHYAVPFYEDFQLFMKRLRINLYRQYNYELPIKYFCCTELGPTTHRCHLHALLYCPRLSFEKWRFAICKAWPYARRSITASQVQQAVDAASYVASYVSSVANLPLLFQEVFKPTHHHSKGFGFGRKEFSFESVLAAYRARNLRYDVQRHVGDALVNVSCLLPKYVISRYFPKIKGYSNLAIDEIISLYSGFKDVSEFSKTLHLDFKEEVSRCRTFLRNKRAFAAAHGLNAIDFGIVCSSIWSVYNSNLLKDNYDKYDDPLQMYDNIADYYVGLVSAPSLDPIVSSKPQGYLFPTDINSFTSIKQSTAALEYWYHIYDKSRKVANLINKF